MPPEPRLAAARARAIETSVTNAEASSRHLRGQPVISLPPFPVGRAVGAIRWDGESLVRGANTAVTPSKLDSPESWYRPHRCHAAPYADYRPAVASGAQSARSEGAAAP